MTKQTDNAFLADHVLIAHPEHVALATEGSVGSSSQHALPGNAQTVPRAKGWALLMLCKLVEAKLVCCSDSLLRTRRFKKLNEVHADLRRAIRRFMKADLCLEIRTQTGGKHAKLPWIRAHQLSPGKECSCCLDLRLTA